MTGLLNGQVGWDFVATQLHGKELKKATSGIVAASKPTPRPAPTPAPRPPNLPGPPPPSVQDVETAVLEQTRALARLGLAARDLGHAIANNLRQLHTHEEHHP